MSKKPDTPTGQLSAKTVNKIVGWGAGCAPVWLLFLAPIAYLMVK